MKTYMFPGQGSQSKGMGAGLFDEFKELTAKADAILGYSIRELCLDDPREELGQTRYTQPALYVVSALSYFKKMQDGGAPPDVVIGHSMGEFNALLAAGCFDFETGLKLVKKRGELMAQADNGAMAAVLNVSREGIEEILKANGMHNVYLANYNTPSQIVLSGLKDEIAALEPFFQQGKMRYYPLAASGAFHTVFMQDAMEQFTEVLKEFTFAAPRIPVIANVSARPYQDDAILATLSRQIVSTVRWSESVQYLLALGQARGDAMQFEELGHGDVLTRLAFTIKQQTADAVLQPLIDEIGQAGATPAAATAPVAEAMAELAAPASGSAADKVCAWNRKYPIGTAVKSTILDYDKLKTRSEAVLLFRHRAAVYMNGYNGYFDLDELIPI